MVVGSTERLTGKAKWTGATDYRSADLREQTRQALENAGQLPRNGAAPETPPSCAFFGGDGGEG
jgi:hypothetical protein